jgi:cation diffusion facilitator CzcD-associated flavoprotein CzcO
VRQKGRQNKLRIAVVGAGISGILCGKRLRDEGFDDYVIYEKGDSVGGTWRDNRYPGIACDTPAHVYCYSFALNPDWSASCAPGAEIHRYLRDIADRYDVTRHVRFRTEITRSEYKEDGLWHLSTQDGEIDTADVLITATGAIHQPNIPEIPGLETFRGEWLHSSRWRDDTQYKGRRVGIIGAGATATQMVTAMAQDAGHLSVFQRTVQWMYPWPHEFYSEADKRAFREDPAKLKALSESIWNVLRMIASFVIDAKGKDAQEIQAACSKHLAEAVKDPALRKKLTPNYQAGCKRLIFNSGFYEAVQRPNTMLVTEAIRAIEPNGVRTADGHLHELDLLVLATGFHTHQYMRPMRVIGPGGVELHDLWKVRPYAYRTLAVPQLPNFFMMIGPGSPIGNFSLVTVAEILFDYLRVFLNKLRSGECTEVQVSEAATRRYCQAMIDAMPGSIWVTGCKSWYLDGTGIPDTWPWSVVRFEEEFKAPDLCDYVLS